MNADKRGWAIYRCASASIRGPFRYIPADVPHLPYNASETEPCVGIIARTDPNEQESVTLLALGDPGVAGE